MVTQSKEFMDELKTHMDRDINHCNCDADAPCKALPNSIYREQPAQLELFPKEDMPSNHQVGGDHYCNFAIQPGEFAYVNELRSWEFSVVKRVCRHRRGGKGLQDIQKAIHELQLIAEIEYGVNLIGYKES